MDGIGQLPLMKTIQDTAKKLRKQKTTNMKKIKRTVMKFTVINSQPEKKHLDIKPN